MIAKIYNILFRSCRHKWITINEGVLEYRGDIVGKWYDTRCDNCGTIKRFTTLKD